MAELFDRTVYFDNVRASLFNGVMSQQQVDGMEAILTGWETHLPTGDLRWLAYMLATTFHETSQQMQPIAEYHGEDQPYGQPDEDGKCWYGRGFVQLTHKENYERANSELGLAGTPQDCVVDPDQQLVAEVAAWTMGRGMLEGWFRSDSGGPQTLPRYFNNTKDDPYTAREIINGDKKTIPSWSNGVSIGNLIKGYHGKFLAALEASWVEQPAPEPEAKQVLVAITQPEGVNLTVTINGEVVVG